MSQTSEEPLTIINERVQIVKLSYDVEKAVFHALDVLTGTPYAEDVVNLERPKSGLPVYLDVHVEGDMKTGDRLVLNESDYILDAGCLTPSVLLQPRKDAYSLVYVTDQGQTEAKKIKIRILPDDDL